MVLLYLQCLPVLRIQTELRQLESILLFLRRKTLHRLDVRGRPNHCCQLERRVKDELSHEFLISDLGPIGRQSREQGTP
jgi:hypothetical protein